MSYPIGKDWTQLPTTCICGLDLRAAVMRPADRWARKYGEFTRVWACPEATQSSGEWRWALSGRWNLVWPYINHRYYWLDPDVTRWWKRA